VACGWRVGPADLRLIRNWASSEWKLPVLAGLLQTLAYLLPWVLPNLVAFIPLLLWIDAHADRGMRGFKTGFLFGVVTHLLSLHFWYAVLSVTWLVILLYLLLVVLFSAKIGLIVGILCRLRRGWALSWGLLLPIAWVPFEWLQTFGDLRMTADHLSYSIADHPFLIQFAALVGPFGVSAFLLAVNGLLYEIWVRPAGRPRRSALIAVVLLIGSVLLYDGWSWSRPDPPAETIRVGLVQPDISLEAKFDTQNTASEQWQVLQALTRDAAARQAELIIWPESAVPLPLYHMEGNDESYKLSNVGWLARELGVGLLAGVEYYKVRSRDDYDVYNAAMFVDRDGELSPSWVAKVFLVPFAEKTPFRSLFGPLVRGRGGDWAWLAGGFEPGPVNEVLDIAGARVGVQVCFEQLFPRLARGLRNAGAEFQVVITNDAWWGRSFFQKFQADVLRMRAIENRTEFVRVANNGISGFVDSRGRYHQQTRLFEQAVEVRDVRRLTGRTLYDRIGDLVAWLATLALVILIAWPRLSRAR